MKRPINERVFYLDLKMRLLPAEEESPGDPSKHYISWTMPISSIVPKAKDSQGKIYCYARVTAFKGVIESVRAEFTRRLLKLLPQIS